MQATKTLYISLIRNNVNLAAPHREPQVEVPPLGCDLAADVAQMKTVISAVSSSTAEAQGPLL